MPSLSPIGGFVPLGVSPNGGSPNGSSPIEGSPNGGSPSPNGGSPIRGSQIGGGPIEGSPNGGSPIDPSVQLGVVPMGVDRLFVGRRRLSVGFGGISVHSGRLYGWVTRKSYCEAS